MDAIVEIQNLGYKVKLLSGKIKLIWRGQGYPDPEKVSPLLAEIRADKPRAIEFLKRQYANYFGRDPGKCETCLAAGYWDGHGPDLWCFYEAAFLPKSAPAQLAKDRRKDCPLKNHLPQLWESWAPSLRASHPGSN